MSKRRSEAELHADCEKTQLRKLYPSTHLQCWNDNMLISRNTNIPSSQEESE